MEFGHCGKVGTLCTLKLHRSQYGTADRWLKKDVGSNDTLKVVNFLPRKWNSETYF